MARGATFNALKDRETGATIVADDDDNEFANVLDNLDPSGIGSYVATTAEHNAVSDPYSGSANQVPADLETRLQQICYQIKQLSGKSNWVVDAAAFGSKGADVASANALVLGTDGNYFDITGTTSILSIGTLGVGSLVRLHFDGILTLTHHATNLILPLGQNIITYAGLELTFVEYAAGDWRLVGGIDLNAQSSFSVNKNSTNQTGVLTATWTKLTWSTEEWDTGSEFASDKFIPNSNRPRTLKVSMAWVALADQCQCWIAIYKNGSLLKGVEWRASGTGQQGINLTCDIMPNGSTDYYEGYVYQASGSTQVVSGSAPNTWFQGK